MIQMSNTEKLLYVAEVIAQNPTLARLRLDQTGDNLYALATGAPPSGAPDLQALGVSLEACMHNDGVSRGYDGANTLILQFVL